MWRVFDKQTRKLIGVARNDAELSILQTCTVNHDTYAEWHDSYEVRIELTSGNYCLYMTHGRNPDEVLAKIPDSPCLDGDTIDYIKYIRKIPCGSNSSEF